ncbi:MAG: cupin domain-containing protein [Gammaproteobacteria bacterium]|jgi:transcriptional regulator with XRE-family HTH domain|nr:cupin domain-containing protein [Gammaproteobacteria bacterium]MDH3750616.1 cupin domain-containing protein [Gammaproteobacteria bacterium]MDH3804721.1 cupin domain-containing protein [Gammaproteobacteria bacterium]
MDQEIGGRLKEIRTQLGMSQRHLARVSGVANATISQIEAGRLNPTVSMLKKVLDGFPMSMSEFFADDFEMADRMFYRAEELTEIADGGVSFLQVGANLRNKSIQLLKECYQPGAGTGKHTIKHDGEECGIILRGRLEVTVADQTSVLRAGDAYYFKSDQPHQFHNPGNEPCELITACSPPSF